MAYLLPHLHSGWAVDQAILAVYFLCWRWGYPGVSCSLVDRLGAHRRCRVVRLSRQAHAAIPPRCSLTFGGPQRDIALWEGVAKGGLWNPDGRRRDVSNGRRRHARRSLGFIPMHEHQRTAHTHMWAGYATEPMHALYHLCVSVHPVSPPLPLSWHFSSGLLACAGGGEGCGCAVWA